MIVTIFVLIKKHTIANSGSTMTYAMRMSATVKMTFIWSTVTIMMIIMKNFTSFMMTRPQIQMRTGRTIKDILAHSLTTIRLCG